MDVGSLETVVAAISVVGFLIFFGSPTVIALVSQVESARLGGPAGPKSEKELLADRVGAIDDESALAQYFAKTFTSKKAIRYVYILSLLFGLASLADLLAAAFGSLPPGLFGVSLAVFGTLAAIAVAVSVGLLLTGVGIALVAIYRITVGAEEALNGETRAVIHAAREFIKTR